MNAAEIVVHVVDSERSDVVLKFFTEGIRQASKPPHGHPHGEVLTFDVAGADMLPIGIANLGLLDVVKESGANRTEAMCALNAAAAMVSDLDLQIKPTLEIHVPPTVPPLGRFLKE